MSQYKIENTVSGVVIGVYQAESESNALDAMARDAGYESYGAACDVDGWTGELRVTLVDDTEQDDQDEMRRDYHDMLDRDFERLGLVER